jgi:hypothetical protein
VGLLLKKNSELLSVKIYQEDLKVQLSPAIHSIFGLKSNQVFTSPSTPVFLPSNLFHVSQGSKASSRASVSWQPRNQMCIQTVPSICSQIKGSKSLPLLRAVHSNPTNTLVKEIFNPVIYMPLNKSVVDSIKIRITYEHNRDCKSITFPTSIALHFRRRQI